MFDNLKKCMQNRKIQTNVENILKNCKDKKIVVYGAGKFARDLFEKYDFSKLNIVAIADIKYEYKDYDDFSNYKKISSFAIPEEDCDIILFMLLNKREAYKLFEYSVKPRLDKKVKIMSLT